MSKSHTALDSPRLTASQRARLMAAGRRLAKETQKARDLYERKIAPHLEQHDRTVAAAEADHDDEVTAILAELSGDDGASS